MLYVCKPSCHLGHTTGTPPHTLQRLRDAVETARHAKEIYGLATDFARKFPNLTWPNNADERRKRVKAVHDISCALTGNDPGKLLVEYLSGRFRTELKGDVNRQLKQADTQGERIRRRIRAMLKNLQSNTDKRWKLDPSLRTARDTL